MEKACLGYITVLIENLILNPSRANLETMIMSHAWKEGNRNLISTSSGMLSPFPRQFPFSFLQIRDTDGTCPIGPL